VVTECYGRPNCQLTADERVRVRKQPVDAYFTPYDGRGTYEMLLGTASVSTAGDGVGQCATGTRQLDSAGGDVAARSADASQLNMGVGACGVT
jgi:hypothetical protein